MTKSVGGQYRGCKWRVREKKLVECEKGVYLALCIEREGGIASFRWVVAKLECARYL